MNVNEPLKKCRESVTHCQNHNGRECYGKSIAVTCLLAMRQSSLRWHDFTRGFCMELGNLNMYAGLFDNLPPEEWGKDKGKRRSTKDVFRGGLTRSSEEVSAMGMEQRG